LVLVINIKQHVVYFKHLCACALPIYRYRYYNDNYFQYRIQFLKLLHHNNVQYFTWNSFVRWNEYISASINDKISVIFRMTDFNGRKLHTITKKITDTRYLYRKFHFSINLLMHYVFRVVIIIINGHQNNVEII